MYISSLVTIVQALLNLGSIGHKWSQDMILLLYSEITAATLAKKKLVNNISNHSMVNYFQYVASSSITSIFLGFS